MNDLASTAERRAAREAGFRSHWWGYGIGLVGLYAFAEPTLRYAHAAPLFLLGASGTSALAFGYWGAIYRGDGEARAMRLVGLICTIGCGIIGLIVLVSAGASAGANERRCLAIQRDMLSARPRRADSPDLFQALGCRPQGEGSVFAKADHNARTSSGSR